MNLHDRITNDFRYHPPQSENTAKLHEAVRLDCGFLAHVWEKTIPPGRELAVALTKLEEAMFWANAAIARNQEEGNHDEV